MIEIRRAFDFLEAQLAMWKTEIRKAEEAVVQAKSELARKRMVKMGDRVGGRWIVEQGLEPGTRVIVEGAATRDGTTVAPRLLSSSQNSWSGASNSRFMRAGMLRGMLRKCPKRPALVVHVTSATCGLVALRRVCIRRTRSSSLRSAQCW